MTYERNIAKVALSICYPTCKTLNKWFIFMYTLALSREFIFILFYGLYNNYVMYIFFIFFVIQYLLIATWMVVQWWDESV